MFKSQAKVIDTNEGRAWCTITDIDSLVTIGFQMNNALGYPGFAESYSRDMLLFFLIEEASNTVLVNASFSKEDHREHMIVGPRNAPYGPQYEDDVEMLREHVKTLSEASSAAPH